MNQTARPLRRILGLGFGLAMVFGGTVGTGILRLPGTLAAALGDSRLVILFWVLGGVWALLGAAAVAELAAMMPEAGGFYVYSRRAFGEGLGFVVGWGDFLNQAAAIAYAALTAAMFIGTLWPGAADSPRLVAIVVLGAFTLLNWFGLRIGSTTTRIISLAVGLMMLVLVVACFLGTPATADVGPAPAASAMSLPLLSLGMLSAVVTALRAVFVTYDGWYSPIYMAEESTEPTSTLPRALLGGTVLLACMYVLFNVAILRVLPMSVLAASKLPAADVARLVLPTGGSVLVTAISLMTVLSLINATLLMAPRILLAIGRDGFFTKKAAVVSEKGTPRLALAVTCVGTAALILSSSFEQIVAIAAVLFLLNYVLTYIAVFVLRVKEPATPRPYRTFGFPVSTGILMLGCAALLIAAMVEDPKSAGLAGALLLACWPIYLWLARRRRLGAAAGTA